MPDIKDIFKNAIVLFLITAVVAALLAGANLLTEDRIAQNKRIAEQNALAEVMDAETFETVQGDLVLVEFAEPVTAAYIAEKAGKIVGYCIKVSPTGYGGEMELIFGVDLQLTMTGVSVLSHSETAGLGANIAKESFRSRFVGKTDGISVVKAGAKDNEIQALSGATISSKAVVRGAQVALEAAQFLARTSGLEAAK